jgi:hypothetical protein
VEYRGWNIAGGISRVEYRGVVSQEPRKIRRRPNFAAFLVSGGLLGLFFGFLVSVFGPAATSYDASATVGFLGLIFAGLGVLAGAVIALLLDRRS